MAKLTRESFGELRKTLKKNFNQANTADRTRVVIGMGTCGLAAGAQETYDAFRNEIENLNMADVEVTGTGCMGLCHVEPTVEVIVPGMPSIVYGNVDGETARRIVREHIRGRKLIQEHVFDKPAVDIIEGMGGN